MAPRPADDSDSPDPDPSHTTSPSGIDSGFRQVWQTVFDAARPGLQRFLSTKLPQTADVEDCLQTLLVKLLSDARRNANRVPAKARRAWLFRVAANEAHSWWRKNGANQTTHSLTDQDPSLSPSLIPSDVTSRNEQAEKVRQAIERLKPEWKMVVKLRLIDEMTFDEIANHLNIPLGTALTRMRRAMQRLRSELDTDSEIQS